MAMDGNMNLVRRIAAGRSSRTPLHEGRFFLPQDDVDNYAAEQDRPKKPEKLVV